jgi:DNA invertase Pin-like site-specific DNA recombinase
MPSFLKYLPIAGYLAARRSGRLQAAIKYCELHKPDYFIAWDTSRFARDRADAAIYKRICERTVPMLFMCQLK